MDEHAPREGKPRPAFLLRMLGFFLRIFFKLLYHQFAWTYDAVAWLVSAGQWQGWVEAVAPYIEGPKVLEIGFGPGHLLLTLSQKRVAAYGLDESRQMTRLAHKRLQIKGFPPKLIRGDARSIACANESFNQVVMTFPSEYIFSPSTLHEIRRVLAPGGKVLILAVAWITGRSLGEHLAAWLNRVSGQAPEWEPKMLERFTPEGFEVGWKMIEFSRSKMVLIELMKLPIT